MPRPGDVTFPRPNTGINNTECKDGSLRDPDESLANPCHACLHIACRAIPVEQDDGTFLIHPCEVCQMVVYARAMFARVNTLENRADTGQNAIQNINDELADHETRLTNGASAITNQGGRLTTAEGTIATHTTQIAARATNANLTAVDTKVNTLKTRVDNAGIP